MQTGLLRNEKDSPYNFFFSTYHPDTMYVCAYIYIYIYIKYYYCYWDMLLYFLKNWSISVVIIVLLHTSVMDNLVSAIYWQYLVISDMRTQFHTQFIGMTNFICQDTSNKYEIFLLLAFIFRNYASVKRQEERVDNSIGTWRHNTKFTSWIYTSHDDKLQCTVYSSV